MMMLLKVHVRSSGREIVVEQNIVRPDTEAWRYANENERANELLKVHSTLQRYPNIEKGFVKKNLLDSL